MDNAKYNPIITGFHRTFAGPMDKDGKYYSLNKAKEYAKDEARNSYVGQMIVVDETDALTMRNIYYGTVHKDLIPQENTYKWLTYSELEKHWTYEKFPTLDCDNLNGMTILPVGADTTETELLPLSAVDFRMVVMIPEGNMTQFYSNLNYNVFGDFIRINRTYNGIKYNIYVFRYINSSTTDVTSEPAVVSGDESDSDFRVKFNYKFNSIFNLNTYIIMPDRSLRLIGTMEETLALVKQNVMIDFFNKQEIIRDYYSKIDIEGLFIDHNRIPVEGDEKEISHPDIRERMKELETKLVVNNSESQIDVICQISSDNDNTIYKFSNPRNGNFTISNTGEEDKTFLDNMICVFKFTTGQQFTSERFNLSGFDHIKGAELIAPNMYVEVSLSGNAAIINVIPITSSYE